MNKNKRLKEIQSFLGEFEFKTKVPDFIGAWTSKEPVENFESMDVDSYMLGFLQGETHYVVLDILGVSTMDNPFITKGIMTQEYDLQKCHSSSCSETLYYYPDKNVKKSQIDKRFPIIDQWDGNYLTGQFDLPIDDPHGIFIIIKNDKGPLFQRLALEVSQKLALSLKLL